MRLDLGARPAHVVQHPKLLLRRKTFAGEAFEDFARLDVQVRAYKDAVLDQDRPTHPGQQVPGVCGLILIVHDENQVLVMRTHAVHDEHIAVGKLERRRSILLRMDVPEQVSTLNKSVPRHVNAMCDFLK
jgi:hypothetical protein